MGLFDIFKKQTTKEIENASAEKTRLEKRKQYIQKQKDIFDNTIDGLEHFKIVVSSGDNENSSRHYDVKFSNITARTNRKSLSEFVVIDTETTGLRETSSVIELSAMRFVNFKPSSIFTTLLKPRSKISDEVSSLTGITNEMVKDSPRIGEVKGSLMEFVGNSNIVGHNLEFDLKILENKDITFGKRKYYDTLTLAKKVLKKPPRRYNKKTGEYGPDYDSDYDIESYSLESLCEYYDIYRNTSHRSASDCLATGYIFLEFLDHIID